MKARWLKKILKFKKPSGTSRGVLHDKPTYYLILEEGDTTGIGECSPLSGLSIDDRPGYEDQLDLLVKSINEQEVINNDHFKLVEEWPSIYFGLEIANGDLIHGGNRILFPSDFTDAQEGININGLIWMGSHENMMQQADSLLNRGFTCLKMKIGAIDFEQEIAILKELRKRYSASELILRVDANGAFDPEKALEKLKILSEYELHSIEQPIKAGLTDAMAALCAETPLDIALDEELIGNDVHILKEINPQFIILKPSLIGGFTASERWIKEAEKLDIGWWATSALESNIGLNAISQWTYMQDPIGHQGLGTGSLYTNNIPSPLEIVKESIYYKQDKIWVLDELFRGI